MPVTISNSLVRRVTLEAIQEESAGGKRSVSPNRVIMKAVEKLLVPPGSAAANAALRTAVLGYWNDLIRVGVLDVGAGETGWDLDVCSVTVNGKKTLEYADRDPANPSGYLDYLGREVPLDPVTRGYVEEALNTYLACCYKASALLIGAAVESLVMGLRDALRAGLKASGEKIPKGLDTWQAKTVLEAIASRVLLDLATAVKRAAQGNRADDALRKLHEDAECRLQPIAAEFRRTRNSAGHPASLDPVQPADVHANLLLFPATARLLVGLKAWVTTYYV